ncbi:ABC-2 type transporter-domain-containing protein [Dactylonectria estremocensis]|uniref:ABC-2 type transporter-domain-containing protein n=1 Tax=Dactylonectria estremocensis TaxID=1079267 RepID=A0A9P9F4A0_9HYPO|nr:ABC-2 type transporter-domain-containing protein [Dactylonectria estremocensis]
MTSTPTDTDTVAEHPRQPSLHGQGSQYASSSATDVEPESADQERGKDFIQKHLTLTFKDVTVNVTAPDEALGETLWSRVDPRQLLDLFGRHENSKRTILHEVTGQVSPGEMLLVLGRPGSGCTSLLRVLSNHRESFQEVLGETRYGSMDHKETKKYRQQIVFNTEDDIHFPTLTVNQTMKFALRNKVPRERPEHVEKKHHFVQDMRNNILDSLGIGHTKKTLVGNEFIRGVSGGERKRVSLAEVMASQSPLQFWDQPTRGLDSKTALEFVETLRRDADVNGKSIVLTTYQAGNGIFDCFNKVIVLAEGRVIYCGPRADAKAYFEDMGFVCPKGANIADFLTSVTVKTEREIAHGFEQRVPTSAEEFEAAYKRSETFRLMNEHIQQPETLHHQVDDLKMAVEREKRQRRWKLGTRGVYTAGLREQVINCTQRQWQIMMGDRLSLAIKVVSATIQALVCGSLFYNLPDTSQSIFLRPGVLFFPVLYFLLESMSETTASFMGRPILVRHKRFGFYRPTAFCIANAITDIPVVMLQVTCFTLIIYFMSGMQTDAGKFFTCWVVVNASTLCFCQLFRAVGAMFNHFGTASYISGLLSTIFFVYGGYLIPFNKMHPWFRWIFYLNPGAYAFESLMANEFDGLQLECVSPQYIPFGGDYNNQTTDFRGCTVLGSDASGMISGIDYVREQYSYSIGHIWRGFGVIVGFWIFLIGLTALGFELRNSHGGSSVLLYKRGARTKKSLDPEMAVGQAPERSLQVTSQTARQSTFSWHDLDYFVQYQGAQKQLLNKVFGFVQPGNLVALMGCSGAGKTTLLDVLAQRKDAGEIKGSILIDGKPQGISFQRMTGYCEQMDVHEATATVREALLFSALLRQPQHVSHDDKVSYVDHIINLLELEDICDALIGTPGAGLSIEQRKRVTLGVELVAKPTLLFLDEPTSGLDGQSAYNIVRFMRRLVDGGQAVLCTIHQPSAVLFDAFDSLLLLAKGGRMAYFGETGQYSDTLLDYFARNGATCPEGVNPAEHIVEVIQGNTEVEIDWFDVWNQSPERHTALQQLADLNREAISKSEGIEEDTANFATSKWFQWKMVLQRQMVQLWRSPDYVWNKINLHIFAALFSGFTFWMIGDGTFDLQLRLFAIFNFIFVAPGCINQMQPYFLHNRDIFETREKKSKTYHWIAFIGSQTVAEIPYLIICATLYFACWYFTAGFPVEARISGHIYLQMIFYEFLYTSIGQAIAAYAPNEYFAAIMNPLLIGAGMISFCGVVMPYAAMQPFWKYWIYYLDPFRYLFGGLLGPIIWDVQVNCKPEEFTSFNAPDGQTCGEYMADFLSSNAGYVADLNATENCQYCAYSTGADYAKTFNLQEEYYGWRDTGITALFCISSYALVFLMMKLRSKKTKSARSE